jgi:hypothetical protein
MSPGSSMRRIGVVKARGMRLVVGTRDPGVVITDFNTSGAEPGELSVVDIRRSRPVPQEFGAAPASRGHIGWRSRTETVG